MSDEGLAILQDEAPLPVYSGEQMAVALGKYRELQKVFDREMPNAIIVINDRPLRKRAYWRAVSVAFRLTVEVAEERREEYGSFKDGSANFGYHIVYRATSPNGRSATGDGSCFAVEKAARWKCPHPHESWKGKSLHFPATSCPDYDPAFMWRTLPPEATEHNVRAHAHTRAYNRAISNLVGFGEVSAEEAQQEEFFVPAPDPSRRQKVVAPPLDEADLPEPGAEERSQGPIMGGPVISDQQRKRFWAICKNAGWENLDIERVLRDSWGLESTKDIPRQRYDAICAAFQKGPRR